MNSEPILVADSGGTGTEWCFVDGQGQRTYFSGRSYHPMYWTAEFIAEEKEFWADRNELRDAKLQFFGAGCLAETNANRMKEIFYSFGFSSVDVRSDLHAAALSTLKNKKGSFGILGTGSVAAEFIEGEIVNIVGGLGYMIWDEGSGFYFGKLLIKKLLNGELSADVSNELYRELGTKQEIILKIYGADGRGFLSGLSKLTSSNDQPEIHEIHSENIALYFNFIKKRIDLVNGFSLVGSYAWHNRKIIIELAKEIGVRVDQIIEKPIERLTEYLLRTAE
jgi:hypothetical protein